MKSIKKMADKVSLSYWNTQQMMKVLTAQHLLELILHPDQT